LIKFDDKYYDLIMNVERRSVCPLSSSLEIIGDKWSLLILRDLFMGKKTYTEFLSSPESISTNVLINRLKHLCQYGVIGFVKDKKSKNIKYYYLTDMGKELLPILSGLALWYEKFVYVEDEPISQHLTNLINE